MLRFTSAFTSSTTNLHGIAVHYVHLLLCFLVRNFHSPLHPNYFPSPFPQLKPGWDDGDAYRCTWGWDPLHLFHGNHQRRRQVWSAMHRRPAGEQWRLRRWAGEGDGIDGIDLQSDGITTDANQLDLVIEVFYGNLNHSEAWMARCKTMNLQDVHVIHFSITVYIFVRVYQHIYI